jgi:Subtilase family/RTX calcium-binding nonapeptide repeat (4 copies)/Domain of unknown function DUF11
MKIWGLVAVAALLVLPSGSAAAGSGATPAGLTAPPLQAGFLVGQDRVAALPLRSSGVANLDSSLQSVAVAARRGTHAAIARAKTLAVPHRGSAIRVIVTGATAADALTAVRLVGGTIEATAGAKVQALVAPASLGRVAREPNVVLVAPPAVPVAQALPVAGEEVGSTNAAAWHAAGVSGITGKGVTVAVIDLGFKGLADAQANGDLPAPALLSPPSGDCGTPSTETDHGTAVAEIVHEIAPDARLLLMCVDSEVTLATAEQAAITQGATIINHSVAWFNTARGDGSGGPDTPDAVVNDAAAHDVLWVNAAGNYAQDHWSGAFTDTTPADGFEDFAPNDGGQSVFVPAGSTFCAYMRWDEWSGTPADDYDLFIVPAGGTTAVAKSQGVQSTTLRPTEDACYQPATDGVYFVSIQRVSGSGTPLIDLFTTGGGPAEYQVAAGSIADPAASPNALAVGAVCWQDGSLEPFSSQGTIGGPVKPDLVADDRMSSFTYGAFDLGNACSPTVLSGFAGTSAAAPTVAGMAALIKQLYPSDTADKLRAYLTGHALDSGPTGVDPQYGAGRALLPSVSPPAMTVAPAVGTPTPGQTLTGDQGTWTGDGEVTLAAQWQRCDAQGSNCGAPLSGLTYPVTLADVGLRLLFQVTATSAIGSTSSTPVLTGVIVRPASPVNTTVPSIQGSLAVGQTLTAVEGIWRSPTVPTFSYKWESCLLATCTPVSFSRTYTLGAADLAHHIRLTVAATNFGGSQFLSTALSDAVQPALSAGAAANLGVTIVPRLAVIAVGAADELVIYVKNAGGGTSQQTHLAVRLPRSVTLLGAPVVERGSGCKGTSGIDCFLDFISSGETTKVIMEVRGTAAGAQPITAFASADVDSDPTDNSATVTLQVGAPTATPPPPKLPPTRRPSSGKTLKGTSRADHLTGTAFADVLNGFGGNDILNGLGGNDVLRGGNGNDTLNGGSGNDILIGEAGLDRLFGGTGNDTIRAQDGRRDTIDCGAGRDTAYVDRIDRVAKNCETIHRR